MIILYIHTYLLKRMLKAVTYQTMIIKKERQCNFALNCELPHKMQFTFRRQMATPLIIEAHFFCPLTDNLTARDLAHRVNQKILFLLFFLFHQICVALVYWKIEWSPFFERESRRRCWETTLKKVLLRICHFT